MKCLSPMRTTRQSIMCVTMSCTSRKPPAPRRAERGHQDFHDSRERGVNAERTGVSLGGRSKNTGPPCRPGIVPVVRTRIAYDLRARRVRPGLPAGTRTTPPQARFPVRRDHGRSTTSGSGDRMCRGRVRSPPSRDFAGPANERRPPTTMRTPACRRSTPPR